MAGTPCGERVGRGTITWPCTLDTGHDGPHYALESTASAGDRRRWEAEQAKPPAPSLAEFQGPAQTTAQRYTENPTPVPLSPGRRSLHAECQPWECYVYDGDQGQRRSAKDECPRYDGSLPPTVGDPEAGTEVGRQTRTDPAEEYLDEVDPRVTAGEKITAEGEFEIRQPTRTRKEDQVLPSGDTSIADDQSLIIADIEKRRQVGIERYGQGHRPFNGRNTLLDGYEEILDWLVYWKSLLRTREAMREDLIKVVYDALVANSIEAYGADIVEMDKQTAAEIAVDRILDAIVVRHETGS